VTPANSCRKSKKGVLVTKHLYKNGCLRRFKVFKICLVKKIPTKATSLRKLAKFLDKENKYPQKAE